MAEAHKASAIASASASSFTNSPIILHRKYACIHNLFRNDIFDRSKAWATGFYRPIAALHDWQKSANSYCYLLLVSSLLNCTTEQPPCRLAVLYLFSSRRIHMQHVQPLDSENERHMPSSEHRVKSLRQVKTQFL